MTCPDCEYATTHPDTGWCNVACLACCVRILQGLRKYGRKAQEARLQAWEAFPMFVGREAVLRELAVQAQMRAMAPLEVTP